MEDQIGKGREQVQTPPADVRERFVRPRTERQAPPPMLELLLKPVQGGDQVYTPLNMPLKEILMLIANDFVLRWLAKMKTTPKRRSHDKYCDFHQDHGHTTDTCYEL